VDATARRDAATLFMTERRAVVSTRRQIAMPCLYVVIA
jgi:hypothetical protein